MQKRLVIQYFFLAVMLSFVLSGCKKETESTTGQADACISETTSPDTNPYEYLDFLSTEEQKRLVISDDPDYEGIAEVKLYDEQVDDTYDLRVFIPDYTDDRNEYPVVYLLGREATISNLKLLKECNTEDAIYVLAGYEDGSLFDENMERDYGKLEETFYHVITDKVMPLIENIYRGSLTESSLCASKEAAAYITQYGILDDGFKFKNYILVSPDYRLMTGNQTITELEQDFAQKEKELSTNIYFVLGKDSDLTDASIETKKLATLMQGQHFENNQVSVEELPGYGSDTVWKPALVEVMKDIFSLEDKKLQKENVLQESVSELSSVEEDSFKYSKIGISVKDSIMSDVCDAYDQEIDDSFSVNVYYPRSLKSNDEAEAVLLPYTNLSEEEICKIIHLISDKKDMVAIVVKGRNENSEERDMYESPGAFLTFMIQNVMQKVEDDMHCSFKKITLAGSGLEGYFAFYTLFHEDTLAFEEISNYIMINPEMNVKTENKEILDFESEFSDRTQMDNKIKVFLYYNQAESNVNKSVCDKVLNKMKTDRFPNATCNVERVRNSESSDCTIFLNLLKKI